MRSPQLPFNSGSIGRNDTGQKAGNDDPATLRLATQMTCLYIFDMPLWRWFAERWTSLVCPYNGDVMRRMRIFGMPVLWWSRWNKRNAIMNNLWSISELLSRLAYISTICRGAHITMACDDVTAVGKTDGHLVDLSRDEYPPAVILDIMVSDSAAFDGGHFVWSLDVRLFMLQSSTTGHDTPSTSGTAPFTHIHMECWCPHSWTFLTQ